MEYCYWCGEPATSKEHVPPKCFFPESKDLFDITGMSFRDNLITVPSCSDHNMGKSHDDEYLMICLSGIVGNNSIAYLHSATKVSRARRRNPLIIQVEKDDVLSVEDHNFPIQWIKTDNYRLIHSLESIARALYFYEFKERFLGKCRIVSRIFFSPEDIKSTKFNYRASQMIEDEMRQWKTQIKGNNPKIFTYQFSPIDGLGARTLSLVFYEKTNVYVAMSVMDEQIKEKCAGLAELFFGDLFNDNE